MQGSVDHPVSCKSAHPAKTHCLVMVMKQDVIALDVVYVTIPLEYAHALLVFLEKGVKT
jgi:hypothetical protein